MVYAGGAEAAGGPIAAVLTEPGPSPHAAIGVDKGLENVVHRDSYTAASGTFNNDVPQKSAEGAACPSLRCPRQREVLGGHRKKSHRCTGQLVKDSPRSFP